MKSRTSWNVKMDKPALPEIKTGPVEWNERFGGNKMVIPTPRLIEKIIFEIPTSKTLKLTQLREHIAEECKADYACPLTTGIFLRIVAEYAEELKKEGELKIPPYWRIIRDDGSLFEKFPGGIESQMEKLIKEGHQFKTSQRGKVKMVS
ncbi:MAG: hypothetical protein IPM92_14710 [Saprospiraceae bacterium]|nr:hypothetical protein [Saprospiraceae bacterium]